MTIYTDDENSLSIAMELLESLVVLESMYVKQTNNPAEGTNCRLKLQDRHSCYSRTKLALINRFRRMRVNSIIPQRDSAFYNFVGIPNI